MDGWLEVDGPTGSQRWAVRRESLVLLGGPLRAVAPGGRAFAVALEPRATVLVERRGGQLAVAVVGGSPMSGPAAERRALSTAAGQAGGTNDAAAALPGAVPASPPGALPAAVASTPATGVAGGPGTEARPAAMVADAGCGDPVRPVGVARSGSGTGSESGPAER